MENREVRELGLAGQSATSGRRRSAVRDVEVPEKPVRRRYIAAYKLRILEEADRALRSLYSWR